REIALIIICIISIINGENDFENYRKLKINFVKSIKQSDLPQDFSDKAFEVVDEFIRKTVDINYEILLYFDYISGEILKCKIGEKNRIKLDFEENEFKKRQIASIHNHPKSVYSPPSPQNFSIFKRKFEDYELVAGEDGLWILEGKLKNEKIYLELKMISKYLFDLALTYSKTKSENIQEIENICNKEYGKLLLNYINNKNINEIQLTKKEYNHD
ncbi:MAG: hypothetical protein ABS871_04760, partial [Methanobrevibacter sp.]